MSTAKKLGLCIFCLLLLVGSVTLAILIVRPQWLMPVSKEQVEADHDITPEDSEPVVADKPEVVLTMAEEILNTMSLEDKIGQIFCIF